MTHQPHPNVTRQIVQLLSEQGFEGMAEAMQQLLNECMKIERQQALGVGPYQRGEERCGQEAQLGAAAPRRANAPPA